MAKFEQRRDLSATETENMWVSYYDSLEGDDNKATFKAEYERYTKIHSWDNAVRVILEKAQIRDGQSVLDAGCGWGRMLIGVVAERTNLTVEAIDISAPAIEIGKDLLGEHRNGNRITWREGNLESLPFDDGTFDAMYSSRVFQHVDNPARAVSEVMRVLKPGGTFAIFLQNKLNPLNLSYYSNLFSPGQVRQWFGTGKLPSELRVDSMDFFPNALGFVPKGLRLGMERTLESVPGLNKLGGKVLAYGRK